ncbi:MAG: hypothetical protein IJX03_07930 [Clostridia bacterium]|nr:hypothetical protein [Clostridia bacterium]
MKTLAFKNFKRNILILLSALLVLSSACFALSFNASAYADDVSPTAELFLPSTDMEYKELADPIDVYSDDKVTAIAQNNQQLLVYQNGTYAEPITSFTAIKQVKKLDDQTLLVSDNGTIYTLSLTDFSKQILYDASEIPALIGGNNFDLNNDYLVSAYSGTAYVYARDGLKFTPMGTFALNANYPVALNDDGLIFYVRTDSYLYCLSVRDLVNYTKIAEVAPSKMIANNDFVYYAFDNKISQIAISNNQKTELPVDAMPEYDLGNLISPSGLTFKNDNLFITDSTLNAVQEFKIENDKLIFTGFAIASGKTAYNRVSKNALDVEKYGDTVAVLDEYKLTVYSPVSANKYARENYKNFIKNDFAPLLQHYALGNGKILYSTTDSILQIVDLNDDTQTSTQISLPISVVLIDDVCYQSGYFYVLVHTNTSSIVYRINENGEQYQTIEIVNFYDDNTYRAVTVDVFGNVYLADTTGKIVLCEKDNSFANLTLGTLSDVIKLETDLGGNLYVLTTSGLSRYDGSAFTAIDIDPVTDGDQIKSFTMNFDKSEVYLLFKDKEYVCECDTLGNYALDKATASQTDYVISDKNTQLNKLQSATVKVDANVYSVTRNGINFDFNGIISPETEYAVICEVKLSDDLILSALAGAEGVVLVNNKELTLNAPLTDTAPETAFVTTNASLYYFPILTENGEYALTDGETVRINKSTMITPTAKLTFLDKEFYFASVTVSDTVYSGYIPVSFTVEVLSEDFTWNEYKIEKINATKLYADKELTTEIKKLSDNQKIRLFYTENGISKIAVEVEEGSWIEGYIKSSAIQNEPNRAVRNILIILAVTASVCGTLTYFLMRRKG